MLLSGSLNLEFILHSYATLNLFGISEIFLPCNLKLYKSDLSEHSHQIVENYEKMLY